MSSNPPLLLIPPLSLSFHPMSFVWRDGGVGGGLVKRNGEIGKERGDESLFFAPFLWLLFIFLLKKE